MGAAWAMCDATVRILDTPRFFSRGAATCRTLSGAPLELVAGKKMYGV
jgi:hypothetical protein